MLVLRSSPPSPFGRKVKIAMKVLGFADRVEVVKADTNDPDDEIRRQNPLGKIPALVLEDTSVLYDSRVILDYLDRLAGGGKIIPNGAERHGVLTRAALADGLTDAALLQVYEGRYRDADQHSPRWVDLQAGKVARALASFEDDAPPIDAVPRIDAIGLACALGYLDLRFEGAWRDGYPNLVAWLERFAAAVPAFEETRFHG